MPKGGHVKTGSSPFLSWAAQLMQLRHNDSHFRPGLNWDMSTHTLYFIRVKDDSVDLGHQFNSGPEHFPKYMIGMAMLK